MMQPMESMRMKDDLWRYVHAPCGVHCPLVVVSAVQEMGHATPVLGLHKRAFGTHTHALFEMIAVDLYRSCHI